MERYPGFKNAVFIVNTPCIDNSKKQMGARGVQFQGKIEEVPDHINLARAIDPDGIYFELAQVLH